MLAKISTQPESVKLKCLLIVLTPFKALSDFVIAVSTPDAVVLTVVVIVFSLLSTNV